MFNQTTLVSCFICFVLNLVAVIFGITLIRVIFFYLQLRGVTVVFLMNKSNPSMIACKLD